MAQGKRILANAEDTRDAGLIPGLGRFSSRKWKPTPVFLPGKYHTEDLVYYSSWGHEESDTTEYTPTQKL